MEADLTRTRVRRLPGKQVEDHAALDAVLDAGRVAHVEVSLGEQPFVTPVGYARDGDRLVLHGSTASRLFRALADGAPSCVTVTLLDGWVFARSSFESSMHYRSAVLLERCTALQGAAAVDALRTMSERWLPGRWADARPPSAKELAATLVLAMPIEESSLKVSDGPPDDAEADLSLPVWAGTVPLRESYGKPVAAPDLRPGNSCPCLSQPARGGARVRTTSTDLEQHYRGISLWHETVPQPLMPRAPLPGDIDVDVAVVGAGYTGLWTSYLPVGDRSDPADTVTGARHRRFRRLGPQRRLVQRVDEVGRAAASEGIDCSYAKGGTVVLARSAVQLARAGDEVTEARRWGFGPEDVRLLDEDATRRRVSATDVLGSTYTPHCAAIHPARLVRGLAAAVERRGVRIYEGTAVTGLGPGSAQTVHGRVRAPYVVRATEGYTPSLAGHRRTLAPVYSLMLATEALSDAVWEQIGLAERETLGDHRHLIIYGQRTADGRMVFGGRGAPYHFGSRISPGFDRDPRVFAELRQILVELFPVLRDVAVTPTWGGPLGVPRDWIASVGLDRSTGLAWGGGYVGDGVATSNPAGRTLADLIAGRDTEIVRLPWVGHRSRPWKPEPLRCLGTNVGLRVMTSADAAERRTGRPSRSAALVGRLLGSCAGWHDSPGGCHATARAARHRLAAHGRGARRP